MSLSKTTNMDVIRYLLGATGAGMVIMSFKANDNANETFWLGLIFLGISIAMWRARLQDDKERDT